MMSCVCEGTLGRGGTNSWTDIELERVKNLLVGSQRHKRRQSPTTQIACVAMFDRWPSSCQDGASFRRFVMMLTPLTAQNNERAELPAVARLDR